jgi:hypothetical protein
MKHARSFNCGTKSVSIKPDAGAQSAVGKYLPMVRSLAPFREARGKYPLARVSAGEKFHDLPIVLVAPGARVNQHEVTLEKQVEHDRDARITTKDCHPADVS